MAAGKATGDVAAGARIETHPDRNPQNPSPETLTLAKERGETCQNGAALAGDSTVNARPNPINPFSPYL